MPTPPPEGSIVTVSERVTAWRDATVVWDQVIVELRNTAARWAWVHPRQSAFTIFNDAGALVLAGTFLEAYPEHVPPGGTAYLEVDSASDIPGTKVSDYATVTADVHLESVDPPGTAFTVSGIKLKPDPSGGFVATGFLTATADVATAEVAVICLDAKAIPLGMTVTNNYHLVRNVTAGQPTGFETFTPTPPLEASACAGLVTAADEVPYRDPFGRPQ